MTYIAVISTYLFYERVKGFQNKIEGEISRKDSFEKQSVRIASFMPDFVLIQDFNFSYKKYYLCLRKAMYSFPERREFCITSLVLTHFNTEEEKRSQILAL